MRRESQRQLITGVARAVRKPSWKTLLIAVICVALYAYQQRDAMKSSPDQALSGQGDTMTGLAKVHDGDTITVNGQHFRIFGIDAPELDQYCDNGHNACGQDAREYMIKLIDGHEVTCSGRDRSYNRIVAVCEAGGRDLGREMVAAGQAVAYDHYSRDYDGEQARAKEQGIGIWAHQFMLPWEWRKEQKLEHQHD